MATLSAAGLVQPMFLGFIVLRRCDTKESTCLLRHIATEKSDLCQYAHYPKHYVKNKNKHRMALNNPCMETPSNHGS